MNAAHIHLLLNHVPVLGTIFGLLLLTFAAWRGMDESTKVSFGVFVIVGLASVVVYLTGEAAEELLEHLPGFSEATMERHEDAALFATVGSALLGATGLVGLGLYRRRTVPGWFRTVALVLALGVTALMAWTANSGGQIIHSEIRSAASTAPFPGPGATALALSAPKGAVTLALAVQTATPEQDSSRRGPSNRRGPSSAVPSLETPESMRIEHAEIHGALVEATRTPGRVGEAARALAEVLHPHFVREEQIALPPLGLLASLARGEFSEGMVAVLPLTDSLEAELPDMLREHEAIGGAARHLERVAREEGNAEVERLARQLQLHARMEEEVTYPAALLVGELVRMRSSP